MSFAMVLFTGQWFGYTFEENSAGVAFVAEDLPAHMDYILDKRYLHLTNGPFMLEQEAYFSLY